MSRNIAPIKNMFIKLTHKLHISSVIYSKSKFNQIEIIFLNQNIIHFTTLLLHI